MRLRMCLFAASLTLAAAFLALAAFGAETVSAGAPTDTPTPTPTRTATPTRTPTSSPTPQPPFVNNEGTTNEIDVYYGYGTYLPFPTPAPPPSLSIASDPPGCGPATISDNLVEAAYPFSFQNFGVRHISWPTACFDSGESINIVPSSPLLLRVDFSPQPAEKTFTRGPGDSAEVAISYAVVPSFTDATQRFSITSNPPGCPPPTTTFEIDENFVNAPPPLSSSLMMEVIATVSWGTACMNEGESITVRIEPRSLVPVTIDFSPPPIPTATPTPAPAPGVSVVIDCDVMAAGLQSNCDVPLGTTSTEVDVVVFNNGPTVQLGTFNFEVVYANRDRLIPREEACFSPYLVACNPAFNGADIPGSNWACGPPRPLADEDTGPAVSSYISCFNGISDGPFIPQGASLRLARVHYDIPMSALIGSVSLGLSETAVFDETYTPLHACGYPPSAGLPLDPCFGATITLVDAPTLTPTPTATATHTPIPTNTNTPTPEGPRVEKQPEGNANSADLTVPKANLWLCEAPAACAGPGEGALRVVERASNVLDGLGAYEFTVEYDNFVIESINPCDLVFGPGGAGVLRGPVDELDTSAVNPDCTPDPGAVGGTCASSLVLENLVHFGCVTSGQAAGPTGDFDLASLLLIPHPDLRNDLFPGNDNGVLTVLKDNGCELVDTLGHPVSGSVNGGLTPFCRDLAVTVRILEGDLDLDCDVDLTDAQSIASRYGAFFGGLLYSKWYDLEPALHDLDIDIKDVQKVFGRQGSSCQTPVPAQPPLDPPFAFGD